MNCKNFVTFVTMVKEELETRNDDSFSTLSIQNVKKNNMVEYTGLLFKKNDTNIFPTIYLEQYYEDYLYHGKQIEEIANDILSLYHNDCLQNETISFSFLEYENVKDKIIFHLVNKEKNSGLFEQIPHCPFNSEMEIVFFLFIENFNHGHASMMIKNEHLELWNVSDKELFQRAKKNTPTLLPPEFQSIEKILNLFDDTDFEEHHSGLYVLTNVYQSYGASVILYDNMLDKLGEFLKDNFYIIPSSVHEILCIREQDVESKEELNAIIKEINEAVVSEEEFLSNYALYYNCEKKIIL